MNSKEIANGILRAVAIIVLVVVGLYTLYLLQSVIVYLIVSLVLTLMGKPLIQFFHRRLRIKSRTFCAILTITIFILLALSVFSLFIPLLVSQGKNLSGLNIDLLKNNLDDLIQQTFSKIGLNPDEYSFGVQEILNFIDIPNFLNSFISFISDFGVGAFSVLFISFFFMKDGEKILIALLSTFPSWEKSCGKHPTQKPLSVLTRLILASTQPDAWILDPFTGSSTTGIAANLQGRKFVGIDKEQEFLELSRRRKLEIENTDIFRKYKNRL